MHEKINSSSSTMKKIFLDAIETGRKYNLEYKNKSIPAPFGLKLKFEMYNKTVFNLLKRVLGIERGRFFPVAGAPLSDTVNEFLQSVNIPIVYGYGLSETTATVCFYPEIGFQFGSIGEVMPDVQVRIDPENSEILVKGKTVMSGYYNKPAENEKAFTEDGYFRTGDAGRMEGNTLFFTERIKDLYKTSNGKYIAPQAIEMVMSGDQYIEQIAVIGDQRKFVSALIVPAYPLLEKYAEEKGLAVGSRKELVRNKEILRLIETHIEENHPTGEALYTLEVEVTHYCACAKCCGSNAQGLTASGKQAAVGMVAMSSHYPFGTQIMINGTMYTVEDRGGSGIENNIHRVDIYVPDHQKALRMGRYTTTATIYRLGR